MRGRLHDLARRIATAIREALRSEAAGREDTGLVELLPGPRLWALSVVLASWELSKPEANRAELAQLLRGSGVTSFWARLDLFAPQLNPFIQAARDASKPEEIAEAALRFFEAVHQIGPPLIRQVTKSRDFRVATEMISRDLKETADSQDDWRPGSANAEREEIATFYLTLIGYSRRQVEAFLSGPKR